MRTRSYPARLPHYSTVRALHSDVGPQVGPSCRTHASRMRNMVVKGWSVGSPLYGGSGWGQGRRVMRNLELNSIHSNFP